MLYLYNSSFWTVKKKIFLTLISTLEKKKGAGTHFDWVPSE